MPSVASVVLSCGSCVVTDASVVDTSFTGVVCMPEEMTSDDFSPALLGLIRLLWLTGIT